MNSTKIDMTALNSAAIDALGSLVGRTMVGARVEPDLLTAVTVRFADGERMTVIGDGDCCQSMTIALRSYTGGKIAAIEVTEPQMFNVDEQGYADGELRELVVTTKDGERTVIRMTNAYGTCMYNMNAIVQIDDAAFVPNDFNR